MTIRYILTKGLRKLLFHRSVDCISAYLKTVWKDKIHRFTVAQGNSVTRLQLEDKFAKELDLIYFIEKEILKIDDIWTINLQKRNFRYYLPVIIKLVGMD